MKPRHRPLALLAALAAASAPAHAATVGRIENLPAAQALGREAFPVDPIGRTWTYRRPDGTTVERQIHPPGGPCGREVVRDFEACRDRVIVTTPKPSSGPRPPAAHADVADCTGGQSVTFTGWVEADGTCIGRSELEKSVANPRYPLRTNRTWTAPSWAPDRPAAATDPAEPARVGEFSHRVLGKARIGVGAGSFPMTAVVESSPIRTGSAPVRRVFYAANVGPVLEQVKDAAGNWITDLELESYEVNPTTVVVESDREGSAGEAERALVPAPSGATAPSRAELGPLEPIPDGANVGSEIFPLGPDGRRWAFRVVRDQSVIERSLPTPAHELTNFREDPPCPDFEPNADAKVLVGTSLALVHYYACPEGLRWKNDFGLQAAPRLWMPLPLQQGSSWATGGPDLEPPAAAIYERDRSRRVLGRALVVTPAGRFEKAVLIETAEPASDGAPERPVRRTYYAANVGPVLVLVPEGDRWVAELVLEAISVPAPEPARGRAATGAAPTNQPPAAAAAPPAVAAGQSPGRPVVRPAP